ncbi:MAG: type IV toxin-antitoxin system AbiEi family antitoxin domain-containing protein [Acidimicrobiales bacterium]
MRLTPDQAIDRDASRHRGLITRSDALASGLTARQIQRRLAIGRWILVTPGLYRVASVPVTWQQRALAVCLVGPSGTVVSHLTAAAVHGLGAAPRKPHVIAPRQCSGRRGLAVVHRIDLDTRDRLIVDGIPCTGVARTLIDCAGLVRPFRLTDLVDDAFCAGLSHPTAVQAMIERLGGGSARKHVPTLLGTVEAWTPEVRPGSRAEVRLLRQIREWSLPEPQSQIELRDAGGAFIGRIELGWPSHQVGLEYDSDRHHNPRHWARDEDRHPLHGHGLEALPSRQARPARR